MPDRARAVARAIFDHYCKLSGNVSRKQSLSKLLFLHFLVDAGFVRHFLEVTAGADAKSAPMSRTDAELLFTESCEKSRREKGSTRTKRKLPKGH